MSKINIKIIIIALLSVGLTAQSCSLLFGASNIGPKGIWISSNAGETWSKSNVVSAEKGTTLLLDSLDVSKIVLAPDRSDVLYLVTQIGIFASDSGGSVWHHILKRVATFDIAPSNSDPAVLYAVGAEEGRPVVYRSGNRGKDWERMYIGSSAGIATTVSVSPADSSDVFVGFASGLLLNSIDGGETWSPVKTFSDEPVQIEHHPNDPRTLYVLLEDQGLLVSRDRANSFVELTNNIALTQSRFQSKSAPVSEIEFRRPSEYISFHIPSSASHNIYLVTNTGLFRSTNSGLVWRAIRLPVDPRAAQTIAATTDNNANVLYVSIDTVVYRSTNNGSSFSTSKIKGTSRFIGALKTLPENSSIIYAGMID